MVHETKYGLGDEVFYLTNRERLQKIEIGKIKKINIGGKVWEEYDVGSFGTLSEDDLFTSFDDAKKEAIKRQHAENNRAIEIVSEYTEPTSRW